MVPKRSTVVVFAYAPTLSLKEEASFVQCLRVLGRHEVTVVCPESLDLGRYYLLCDQEGVTPSVQRFENAWFESTDAYNALMLHPAFYHRFSDYEYILICQLDAWVFSDQLDAWCDKNYTYVGAPFFSDAGVLYPFAGNGGFSLRRVASFIALLEGRCRPSRWNYGFLLAKIPADSTMGGIRKRIIHMLELAVCRISTQWYCRLRQGHEDYIFAKAFSFTGKEDVPLPEEAACFAFERFPEQLFTITGGELPFGCHAYEKHSPSFWRSWIPE